MKHRFEENDFIYLTDEEFKLLMNRLGYKHNKNDKFKFKLKKKRNKNKN